MASRKVVSLCRIAHTLPAPTTRHILQCRAFSATIPFQSSEGGDQNPQRGELKDREKINTEPNENTKSATDDTAAKNEKAAFDPNITSPEGAKEKAGEGNKENPLEVSPANPKVSQGTTQKNEGSKKGSV